MSSNSFKNLPREVTSTVKKKISKTITVVCFILWIFLSTDVWESREKVKNLHLLNESVLWICESVYIVGQLSTSIMHKMLKAWDVGLRLTCGMSEKCCLYIVFILSIKSHTFNKYRTIMPFYVLSYPSNLFVSSLKHHFCGK